MSSKHKCETFPLTPECSVIKLCFGDAERALTEYIGRRHNSRTEFNTGITKKIVIRS